MKLPVKQPAEWYKDGLKFECTGCGNCCTGGPGFVWISEVEIARLAEYLKVSTAEVLKRYCRKVSGEISLKEKVPNSSGDYDCIFLKEVPVEAADGSKVQHTKRICTVYPVRPLQCRTWPFWEGNLLTEQWWEAAAKRCPGMNAGPTRTREQIIARRDATDWPAD